MEQGENWAPGSERATTGWKDLLVEGRIRIRRESNKERDNEGRSARETEAGARVCVSSLRGAREQPPPHRGEGEGGAKLQNIVSHRSACKLAGIYLIRGQSAYIRVCRLEGEKNARGKKGRVKDARRASRRSSSFFFLFFSFSLSFFFFLSYQLDTSTAWHSSVSRTIPFEVRILYILENWDSSSSGGSYAYALRK